MSDRKQRHGCLTALLILMIVLNSATALSYLLGSHLSEESIPGFPAWALLVMAVVSVFNVICAIALWYWKFWGFWGCVITSLVALAVNLSVGISIGYSLLGLLGIALLFGVLQIGKNNKGWTQLD